MQYKKNKEKQLYANNIENMVEMYKFLEKHNLPRVAKIC